jgi:NCAIR mutase (PurE)-related protein
MKSIKEILKDLQDNKISLEETEKLLKSGYIEQIDDQVQLDMFRHHRTGIPEVIFAETKNPPIVIEIAKKMLEKNHFALISRTKPEHIELIEKNFGADPKVHLDINRAGRIIVIHEVDFSILKKKGKVGIITAGTSDIPVAEEARAVLISMGIETLQTYDVGIAGIHRIFPPLKKMIQEDIDVIIVIAGMEGTLPGVISALVDIPVIGVPTSTGYGYGAHGQGALTTMLQSCSPGLAVINIDNGFGAAALAALIIKRIYEKEEK